MAINSGLIYEAKQRKARISSIMKLKLIFSSFLSISLASCGMLSSSGPSSEIATGAIGGVAIGAGVGALVGSVIDNGDIAKSAMMGAGAGLAVGMAAGYAYQKIKIENEISDNRSDIESNREEILSKQQELDRMRAAVVEESRGIPVQRGPKVYDGATLEVYYR